MQFISNFRSDQIAKVFLMLHNHAWNGILNILFKPESYENNYIIWNILDGHLLMAKSLLMCIFTEVFHLTSFRLHKRRAKRRSNMESKTPTTKRYERKMNQRNNFEYDLRFRRYEKIDHYRLLVVYHCKIILIESSIFIQ